MNTTDKLAEALPPLPPPHWPREYFGGVPSGAYTKDQMHAYARAAIAAAPAAPAPHPDTKDAERIQHFEDMANKGFCPSLVFDDDGRWAVSYSGAAPVPEPEGHEETVYITVEVEPNLWRHSVREAIDAAIAASNKEKA